MELGVKGYDFGMLVEGDNGKLTFQGTDFISFDKSGRDFVYGEQ